MTDPLLAGGVAVITVAANGIRRQIARSLHRHGAKVVLVDSTGRCEERC